MSFMFSCFRFDQPNCEAGRHDPVPMGARFRIGTAFARRTPSWALLLVLMSGIASGPTMAEETSGQGSPGGGGGGSLAEVGKKLSNPLSDVWALFTEFDVNWFKGDLSDGDYKVGTDMLFQPVMPFKLTKDWKLITRPAVPISFGTPLPDGLDAQGNTAFNYTAGLADIQLPLLFSPNPKPGSPWTFGGGPTFVLPTATVEELGAGKWEAGPALVGVYATKKFTVGALGQYWWSFADSGRSRPDTSHGSLLYFYFYNLPNAWQIGTNPTITYNDKAASGNQWNVPIGLTVAKMTKIGKVPVKFQLGAEYSVVSQDSFGQEWQVKLNIIPVIPALVKNPLF